MVDYREFLCFHMSVISRKISRSYNRICTEYGVTASQSFILFDLLAHEGSSMKDMAARIMLDPPAITNFIDRLLKENLVVRIEDPSDRRTLRLHLTNKGKETAQKLLPQADEFNKYIRRKVGGDSNALQSALMSLEKDQLNYPE